MPSQTVAPAVSPLPWTRERQRDGYYSVMRRGYVVAVDVDRDDAAAFVTAVNAHAALVEALREMRGACAACFRVIAMTGDAVLVEAMRAEIARAGVAEGFGKRAEDVLAALQLAGVETK